ncbi:hypothetical protein Apa02nite_067330 [Actinoplanes palleronii]|uniref:Uncharacterized protein n=1 Tax=Actinoplanes palleronii TaxID=113570 RepID=A0ABQ4BIX2_9ACTN|nr:hypothetical protein Apa02nite_067330 [Actinoplanes palleronii]
MSLLMSIPIGAGTYFPAGLSTHHAVPSAGQHDDIEAGKHADDARAGPSGRLGRGGYTRLPGGEPGWTTALRVPHHAAELFRLAKYRR